MFLGVGPANSGTPNFNMLTFKLARHPYRTIQYYVMHKIHTPSFNSIFFKYFHVNVIIPIFYWKVKLFAKKLLDGV